MNKKENLSPKSINKKYCNIPPKIKKKMKVIETFKIPQFNEYDLLMNYNYKVPELKLICRHYKLKISGNKNELLNRTYTHLKLSFNIQKIQKIWKKYLNNKYNALKGPALIKRNICINDIDFYSMEPINKISYEQFISYKDDDGKIYGFDILSFIKLIKSETSVNRNIVVSPKNPYNRNDIPVELINNLSKILKISKFMKDKVETEEKIENTIVDEKKEYELKILNIFQIIDSLGFYTDHNWFLEISNNRIILIRFIRELYDIWNYRLDLSHLNKRQISPPIGDPFRCSGINLNIMQSYPLRVIQDKILILIGSFVKNGLTNDFKYQGASIVLSGLTLVSENAANGLPWLYQSVVHM